MYMYIVLYVRIYAKVTGTFGTIPYCYCNRMGVTDTHKLSTVTLVSTLFHPYIMLQYQNSCMSLASHAFQRLPSPEPKCTCTCKQLAGQQQLSCIGVYSLAACMHMLNGLAQLGYIAYLHMQLPKMFSYCNYLSHNLHTYIHVYTCTCSSTVGKCIKRWHLKKRSVLVRFFLDTYRYGWITTT